MSSNPAIILVRPQMPENIGAAARAMANFGLTDLRLVEPREEWPSVEAERNAAGALEGIVTARVFDTLPDAITDLNVTFATTARTRDMNKQIFTPHEAVEHIQTSGFTTGLIFGPERTGLTNEDLKYCQHVLTFPVNPDFSSLNLAQAVLLMGYTLYESAGPGVIKPDQEPPASQQKLEDFFLRLEGALEDNGFYKAPHLKESIQRNIRTMFMRADFTDQELSTLQGVLSAFIQKN
ncbi:MAG: RNA methyltransferase [Alphaproteobacteria bacterium]|nr:RNA methyltransferase [Alphaproteobacteria bacterium]MCD8520062.1 RNA methyltransferase [Alphaproteobacteria bacterium]MCD8525674.1 RNA methyltransferase [Alphaproteobacteria bacterium]MCD8570934.1 RNA methyltransferase [Alphaproteobacteria bacterium]